MRRASLHALLRLVQPHVQQNLGRSRLPSFARRYLMVEYTYRSRPCASRFVRDEDCDDDNQAKKQDWLHVFSRYFSATYVFSLWYAASLLCFLLNFSSNAPRFAIMRLMISRTVMVLGEAISTNMFCSIGTL